MKRLPAKYILLYVAHVLSGLHFGESDKYKAIYCLFKALVGMQVNLIVVLKVK